MNMIEIERALGSSRTITVGYQYFRGEKLLMSINQNVPTCVAAGTNNGCRPVSTYANNNDYRGAGESNYHGLHVTFLQRPSTWSSIRATYTPRRELAGLYGDLMAEFEEIYRKTHGVYRRLNRE